MRPFLADLDSHPPPPTEIPPGRSSGFYPIPGIEPHVDLGAGKPFRSSNGNEPGGTSMGSPPAPGLDQGGGLPPPTDIVPVPAAPTGNAPRGPQPALPSESTPSTRRDLPGQGPTSPGGIRSHAQPGWALGWAFSHMAREGGPTNRAVLHQSPEDFVGTSGFATPNAPLPGEGAGGGLGAETKSPGDVRPPGGGLAIGLCWRNHWGGGVQRAGRSELASRPFSKAVFETALGVSPPRPPDQGPQPILRDPSGTLESVPPARDPTPPPPPSPPPSWTFSKPGPGPRKPEERGTSGPASFCEVSSRPGAYQQSLDDPDPQGGLLSRPRARADRTTIFPDHAHGRRIRKPGFDVAGPGPSVQENGPRRGPRHGKPKARIGPRKTHRRILTRATHRPG